MKIVLFAHPSFLPSQSMPKYVRMLADAYRARGHQVQIWAPEPRVYSWVPQGRLSKWAGYIDRYVLFPRWVKKAVAQQAADTLFAFGDQALGPWVHLVRHRPHVVHRHDFTALRSALGHYPENPTSWTGKGYQRYTRRGFRQACNFLSVSQKTKDDLHDPVIGGVARADLSEVVYNGLNYAYAPMDEQQARSVLASAGVTPPTAGYVLHVGGNQWYKNLAGVISMYSAYAKNVDAPIPLWLVSPRPTGRGLVALQKVPAQGEVRFLGRVDNEVLRALYSMARAFLFPSLAEGFGWPIVESQACGCLVITTNEAPMTEIGGPVARYIARLQPSDDIDEWAQEGARQLQAMLALSEDQRRAQSLQALEWTRQFSAEGAIDAYLSAYERILHASVAVAAGSPTGLNEKNAYRG